jgi:GTP-binding protein YchF
MNVGIVGLPQSGKTTVFNAITRGSAEVATYAAGEAEPNLGVAGVPDNRLDSLAAILKPKRTVTAEIGYVDAPSAADRSGGLVPRSALNDMHPADAIAVVVRAFEDPAVSHVDGSVDAARDAESALLELALTDTGVLDRRLARIEVGFKGLKAAERDALTREQALVLRVKDGLEGGTAVSDQTLTDDEARALGGFGLLTAKPAIVVVNVGEDQADAANAVAERVAASVGGQVHTVAICGALEMELAQLDPAEEAEMREGLGAGEPALERMARVAHEAGDMVAFFTGNGNEVRSWTVPRGTTALKAAGRIHSDFERGFIRAEVIGTPDLLECGSAQAARKRGLLRSEGKGYVVQDGDVVNFLFSV